MKFSDSKRMETLVFYSSTSVCTLTRIKNQITVGIDEVVVQDGVLDVGKATGWQLRDVAPQTRIRTTVMWFYRPISIQKAWPFFTYKKITLKIKMVLLFMKWLVKNIPKSRAGHSADFTNVEDILFKQSRIIIFP